MVILKGKLFHIRIVEGKKMIYKLHNYTKDVYSDVGTLLCGW